MNKEKNKVFVREIQNIEHLTVWTNLFGSPRNQE